jgi:uncharacterized protein YbaP (TraB family)
VRRGSSRALLALAGIALAVGCASAPDASLGRGSVAQPAALSPLLWHANGEEGRGSLFLLGSVHLGTPDSSWLNAAVAEAYERSDELVVEIDLSRVSPAEAAAATQRYGTLPPGQTLASVVSPETYAELRQFLNARGLAVESFGSVKPWLVATSVALMHLQEAGLDAQFGVDRQFIGRAEGRKPIVPLETVESQLEMMDSLAPEIQELLLADALTRVDEVEIEPAQMVESWQHGDEEALADLFFGALEQHPEFAPLYEKLYFERNEAMTRRLAELAGDGKTRFTVIGAGHMVGPRGIPALLAARGFRVERIGH